MAAGALLAIVATAAAAAASAGPLAGRAAAPAIGAQAPAMPGLAGTLFALFAVIALILALAWILKRLPGAGLRQASGLRVVASLALGTRERVVVVEVGGQQLLLGVSPAGVHPLHTLAAPLPEPAPAPRFAELLAQARGRGASPRALES